MVSALVRAGRARGLVSACLANGRRSDAKAICRLHYRAGNASDEDRKAVADVMEGGAKDKPKPDSKGDSFLKRFAGEFGLELSCTEEE